MGCNRVAFPPAKPQVLLLETIVSPGLARLSLSGIVFNNVLNVELQLGSFCRICAEGTFENPAFRWRSRNRSAWTLVQCKNIRARCDRALFSKFPTSICAAMELCARSADRATCSRDVRARTRCRSNCLELKLRIAHGARSWLRALDQSLIVSVRISASTRSCEGMLFGTPQPLGPLHLFAIEALTGSESPKRKRECCTDRM